MTQPPEPKVFTGVTWNANAWRPHLTLASGRQWFGCYQDQRQAAWVREAAIVAYKNASSKATRNFPGQEIPEWANVLLRAAIDRRPGQRGKDKKPRKVQERGHLKGRKYQKRSLTAKAKAQIERELSQD